MKIDHPLLSVTGGLEGVVLQVLAGTTEVIALGDIHRLAGTASKSGVRKAIIRLVSNGIVDAVPGGYTLNREHLASSAIVQLAGLRGLLFERIREVVTNWPNEVHLVGIFGSLARGVGDEKSDIDVLVIGDDVAEGTVGHLAEQVQRWTGNVCHVVALTRKELDEVKRRKESILESWRQDLVVVHGDKSVLSQNVRA